MRVGRDHRAAARLLQGERVAARDPAHLRYVRVRDDPGDAADVEARARRRDGVTHADLAVEHDVGRVVDAHAHELVVDQRAEVARVGRPRHPPRAPRDDLDRGLARVHAIDQQQVIAARDGDPAPVRRCGEIVDRLVERHLQRRAAREVELPQRAVAVDPVRERSRHGELHRIARELALRPRAGVDDDDLAAAVQHDRPLAVAEACAHRHANIRERARRAVDEIVDAHDAVVAGGEQAHAIAARLERQRPRRGREPVRDAVRARGRDHVARASPLRARQQRPHHRRRARRIVVGAVACLG